MTIKPKAKNNHRSTTHRYEHRINDKIRAREVRVVLAATNEQLGILRIEEALKIAKSYGLDLVEVTAKAHPPVCRIVDYGKYRYELAKHEKDKKHVVSKVKEIKFRARIELNDYLTKIRHAEEFLDKGNKLKVSLQFRGREMAHQEIGYGLMQRIEADLAGVAQVDRKAQLNGRNLGMTLTPLPANKRKKRWTHHETQTTMEETFADSGHDDDAEDDEGEGIGIGALGEHEHPPGHHGEGSEGKAG